MREAKLGDNLSMMDLIRQQREEIARLRIELSTARADAIGEAINELAERRKAYPESIFTPLVEGETAKVHEQWPGLVDRISADVCRWILDDMIATLEQLKEENRGNSGSLQYS